MARVVKIGGALIVAHLMSRKELSAHHGSHATVARDVLPPDPEMEALFVAAGLSEPQIVDIPGRYMAKTVKLLIITTGSSTPLWIQRPTTTRMAMWRCTDPPT